MAKANKPDRTDRTELRAKIRAAYVQGSDLTVAAAMHSVPYATAVSWKKAGKESGDDWDVARRARQLASAGPQEMFAQILEEVGAQFQHVTDMVKTSTDMPAVVKGELLVKMVDSLSRGIQQRLCLARAMIHKPKLLVLDEPNSGLDPRSRKDFQLLLQRLAREDYTILISSHILSELADLCTSIGVINGGVMVQQGKLENIMLAIDSSNPLRITVLNQVPKALELLRQDPQVSRLSVDENKIAAWFSGSREEEAYLLQKLVDAGILVVSFAREHNSLESLFFHLTGETEQKSRNTETFGNTIG